MLYVICLLHILLGQYTLPIHPPTFFMWWISKYRLFSNRFFGLCFKGGSFTSKVIFCCLSEFINSLKRNYFMISTKEPWACLKSVLLSRRDLYYFLSCDQHKDGVNIMLNFSSLDAVTCSIIKLNWAREDTYALYCEKDLSCQRRPEKNISRVL